MTRFAHLSDCHLDTTPERLRRFQRVLDEATALGDVDGMIITGDIADHGSAAEYTQFFNALPSAPPVAVIPGNHDDRATMSAFTPPDDTGHLNTVLDAGGVSIVGLDSLVEDQVWGLLTEQTLAFAHEALTAATGPVVLALHHPPVPVGHHLMDHNGVRNADALGALVRGHDHVVAILTGHVHTALATTFAGVPLIGAPGIVSTMRLGSRTDPIADDGAMPGLALHTVDDTHLSTIFHYLSPDVPG